MFVMANHLWFFFLFHYFWLYIKATLKMANTDISSTALQLHLWPLPSYSFPWFSLLTPADLAAVSQISKLCSCFRNMGISVFLSPSESHVIFSSKNLHFYQSRCLFYEFESQLNRAGWLPSCCFILGHKRLP